MLDEISWVFGPINDVDLLAVQFVHDVAHALTQRSDARTLGIDALALGVDCNLGAVTGFAGHGDQLYGAISDLRDFQREEFANQSRVGARQGDLWAALSLAHANNETLNTLTVDVLFAGDLFGRREQPFKAAEVDHHIARVTPLLDHPRDHIAFATCPFAKRSLIVNIAQALHDDLAGRGGGNTAKTFRCVLKFRGEFAFFCAFATHPDRNMTRLLINLDASMRIRALGVVISRQQRSLQSRNHDFKGDFFFCNQCAQRAHVDIHVTALLRCRQTHRFRR